MVEHGTEAGCCFVTYVHIGQSIENALNIKSKRASDAEHQQALELADYHVAQLSLQTAFEFFSAASCVGCSGRVERPEPEHSCASRADELSGSSHTPEPSHQSRAVPDDFRRIWVFLRV